MELNQNKNCQELTLLEFQGSFTKYVGIIDIEDGAAKVGNQIIQEKERLEPKFLYSLDKETMQINGIVKSHRKFTQRPHLDL